MVREPDRSPLDGLPVTGDTEADDAVEIGAVLAEMKAADDRVRKSIGQDYFCSLVFVSSEQRDAFLAATGWAKHLIPDTPYLDGLALAKALGVQLPQERLPFRGGRADRVLVNEVGIIGEEDA